MPQLEIAKPPERGILVVADDLDDHETEALRLLLEDAAAKDDWPVVLVGIQGPVYWVGGIEDLPAELRAPRVIIHTPERREP